MRIRTPKDALLTALVGAWTVVAVPIMAPDPWAFEQVVVLLGAWLATGSVFQWWVLRRTPERSIPITFSGATGRFRLRVRDRGREVIVQRGPLVVAQASATARGDRLVVHPDQVADSEVEALGSAIGQAIQLLADADPEDSRSGGSAPRFAPVARTTRLKDSSDTPLARP